MQHFRHLSVLLALSLVVLAAACSSGDDDSTDPTVIVPPTSSPSAEATPTVAASANPTRVQGTGEDVDQEDIDAAETYLTALTAGDYPALWEMLADQTKALWGSPETLVAFLSNKYGGRQMAFRLGAAQALANWRDYEAHPFYATATSVSYELDVDSANAPAFSLMPVVVIPGDGGPRIAGLGPAARRAPVVTPLPATTGVISMPILVYHHVQPELPANPDQASITVTSSEFEDQLIQLDDDGYESITVAELTNHLYYGLPLVEKPVILTFDDGYDDALIYATHLMDAHGFFGTFGIVSGFIGSPEYLTWDQVREMRDAGMEIISHSATHPGLGDVPPEQLAAEIAGSKVMIETEARVPVQALIYPYGEPFANGTQEQQDRVKAALRDAGYAVAITNPLPGAFPDILQDGATPYEFNRLMVSPNMSLDRFMARLTGAELE